MPPTPRPPTRRCSRDELAPQIAASRVNGRKSLGPRTAAGKWRASRNALRHGLNLISRHNSAYFPEIERIARAYCEGDNDPSLFEPAMIIAENDVIIMRVEVECLAAIARMRDPDAIPFSDRKASLARARARFEQAKLLHAELMRARFNACSTGNSAAKKTSAASERAATGDTAASPTTNAAEEPQAPAQYDEFEAVYRAAPDLVRLARYRRRAVSRRNRAIREFIFVRSLREFQLQAHPGTMMEHDEEHG
jgi:hypothetical protein